MHKDPASVNAVFSAIAGCYDRCNHIISLGLHQRWRRALLQQLDLAPGSRVLDCCTGTGALLPLLAARGYRTIGADFCLPMLQVAQQKSRQLGGDWLLCAAEARQLPFPSASFAAITVAFGIRSFPDRLRALQEFYRVLRPGGVLLLLEAGRPKNPLLYAGFSLYAASILPLAARLLRASPGAYQYLAASSRDFKCWELAAKELPAAGFSPAAVKCFACQSIWLLRSTKISNAHIGEAASAD